MLAGIDVATDGMQTNDPEPILQFSNYDLENIVTPVDADMLERLLSEADYNKEKTMFLVNGFKNGFSLGYHSEESV